MAKESISLSELSDVVAAASAVARQGGVPLGVTALAVRAAGDALSEIIERIGRKEETPNG